MKNFDVNLIHQYEIFPNAICIKKSTGSTNHYNKYRLLMIIQVKSLQQTSKQVKNDRMDNSVTHKELHDGALPGGCKRNTHKT